jgi:hypothetical protein
MARQRDYAAEYARRQARARAEGFSSYGAKRAAQSKSGSKKPTPAKSSPRAARSRGSGNRSRDYAKEYQQRQAKARAQGERSYGAKRYRTERNKRLAVLAHNIAELSAVKTNRPVNSRTIRKRVVSSRDNELRMTPEELEMSLQADGQELRALAAGNQHFHYH